MLTTIKKAGGVLCKSLVATNFPLPAEEILFTEIGTCDNVAYVG